MKIRLAILTLICIFGLMGCSGTQINWNIDKQALAEVAANEAGYQMAKHLPDVARIALKYANDAMNASNPETFKVDLNVWKEYVLGKIGADPHYVKQLSRLLPEIELPETQTPDSLIKWMAKVKPYLSEFILGIQDGLLS